MNPLAEALANSPELFPSALDLRAGSVALMRLTRPDYERASFLDGRISRPETQTRHVPFAQLAAAIDESGLQETCHFIFHVGHAGSTLLSRLLARHPAIFSLREPEVLRMLALAAGQVRIEPYLPAFLKLWSRTFDPQASALVKTTSFVSEIAPNLLARAYAPKALAMGVGPEIYLATILAGANAPVEARSLAPFRLARLQRRVGTAWKLEEMGMGELIAMSWMSEALCLAEVAESFATRVLVLDFENFLSDPAAVLPSAFAHFGIAIGDAELAHVLAGPEMSTYSKAPEHTYDSSLRRSVLNDARSRHGDDIRRGLRWLEKAATACPEIRDVIGLFG